MQRSRFSSLDVLMCRTRDFAVLGCEAAEPTGTWRAKSGSSIQGPSVVLRQGDRRSWELSLGSGNACCTWGMVMARLDWDHVGISQSLDLGGVKHTQPPRNLHFLLSPTFFPLHCL